MKPIYVVLIAIASAIAGAFGGSLIGGAAGSVAGGTGGGLLGMRAGICSAVETAKAENLLTQAQAEQVTNQSYARIRDLVENKNLIPTDHPDCQTTFNQVNQLGK